MVALSMATVVGHRTGIVTIFVIVFVTLSGMASIVVIMVLTSMTRAALWLVRFMMFPATAVAMEHGLRFGLHALRGFLGVMDGNHEDALHGVAGCDANDCIYVVRGRLIRGDDFTKLIVSILVSVVLITFIHKKFLLDSLRPPGVPLNILDFQGFIVLGVEYRYANVGDEAAVDLIHMEYEVTGQWATGEFPSGHDFP